MHEFTSDDALRLIEEMQTCYGKRYSDQWVGVDDLRIATQMVKVFKDLTAQEFKRGLQRMYQSAFCPTLPEFKQWCLQGSTWLTEHEAWAQALAYEKSGQTISISRHVLKTLKEFKKGFDELNPRAESQSKAFKDMYVRIVTNAKLMGDVQSFTDPVGALKAPKEDERRTTTCPPELMAQMKGINKSSKAGRA